MMCAFVLADLPPVLLFPVIEGLFADPHFADHFLHGSPMLRTTAICSSVYLDFFTAKSSYFLIVDFAEELSLSMDLLYGDFTM